MNKIDVSMSKLQSKNANIKFMLLVWFYPIECECVQRIALTLFTVMYACIYVCMYLCMYVSMYVCMYLCIYVSMYVCMYVCMYNIHPTSLFVYVHFMGGFSSSPRDSRQSPGASTISISSFSSAGTCLEEMGKSLDFSTEISPRKKGG